LLWKEELVEDERGRDAIQEKVVPLDDRADDTRKKDAADLFGRGPLDKYNIFWHPPNRGSRGVT